VGGVVNATSATIKVMDTGGGSVQTVPEGMEDAMRVLSLVVGLVVGFFVAAWFYGAGGALVIAGKQIGPDILTLGDVHSEGSGRTVEPGSAPSSPSVGSTDEPSQAGSQNKEKPVRGENPYFKIRWPK
jgi:hypothetical protein